MSDTDTASAEPAYSGDEAGLRQAAADLEATRAAAEVDQQYNPSAPEIPPPPEGKRIADDGQSPLSSRKAARLYAQQKHDEATRAAGYREGLADPGAWSADAANRTGEFPDASAATSGEASTTDPLAAERAQIEAERQYYAQEQAARQQLSGLSSTEQQLWAAEQELGQRIVAATNEFNQKYADCTTTDAILRMQQADPARHAALVQEYGVLQAAAEQLGQFQQQRGAVAQQRIAVGTQEFNRVAELHDAAFMREHPELEQNPGKLHEIQQHAQKYLAEKGIGKDELTRHWHGQASFSLREKISQDILLDAVQWRMAQDRFAQLRNNGRQLPPVQRPGVAQQSSGKHEQIEGYNRRISRSRGTEQLKLLAARQSLLQRQR